MQRGFFLFLILIANLLVGRGLADEACLNCHQGFRSSCGLTCDDCHRTSPPGELTALPDHPAVIRNPSMPQHWQQKCAACHLQQIDRFKNSLHYSAAGVIVQTRYLLGSTATLNFAHAQELWRGLTTLQPDSGHGTAALADRLLTQKCLACHFAADARQAGAGKKRAAGCAACHVPFDQQSGEPLHGHRMQRAVSDTTCLTCHNGNHVGGDYYGYFEHDYRNEYQSPYGSKPWFDAYQHRLQSDVHRQAGMRCTDCHKNGHGHDDRSANRYEGKHQTITCTACHGGFYRQPAKTNPEIPKFRRDIVAHKSFHSRVTCVACHAGWSYQDYGLHLFLDESNHYQPWEDFLWQGDFAITRLLQKQLSLSPGKRTPARTPNRLNRQPLPGAWYKAWTFRRWEDVVLGKDAQGNYAPIRPLYQFHITYVDSQDNVWLDSAIPQTANGKKGWNWDVYTPHTVTGKAQSCEGCHGNPLAAGLGIRNSANDRVAHPITIPDPPILPGTRLLNAQEQKKLLGSSEKYKKWRARAYKEQGMLKLFESR